MVVLKRCPFCGSRAKCAIEHSKLPTGHRDTFFRIECELRECGIGTRWWYPKRAAVWSWNRRLKLTATGSRKHPTRS